MHTKYSSADNRLQGQQGSSQTGPADATSGTEEACIVLAFLQIKNLALPTLGLSSTHLLTQCFMLLLAMDSIQSTNVSKLSLTDWESSLCLPFSRSPTSTKISASIYLWCVLLPFSTLQRDLLLPSLQVTRESLLNCCISFLCFTAFGEESCQGLLENPNITCLWDLLQPAAEGHPQKLQSAASAAKFYFTDTVLTVPNNAFNQCAQYTHEL